MYCSGVELPDYDQSYESSRCININPSVVENYKRSMDRFSIKKFIKTTHGEISINPYFQRHLSCLVDAILTNTLASYDINPSSVDSFSFIFHQLRVLPYGVKTKGVFDIQKITRSNFEELVKIHNPLKERIPSFQYIYGFTNEHMVCEGYDVLLSDVIHTLSDQQVRSIIDQILSACVLVDQKRHIFLRNVGLKKMDKKVRFETCEPNSYFETDLIALITTNSNIETNLKYVIAGFISDVTCSFHEKIGYEYWDKLGFTNHEEWMLGKDLVQTESNFFFSGSHVTNIKPKQFESPTDCDLINVW